MENNEKILDELMKDMVAGKTTYFDVNKKLDDLKKLMMQKLIDEEFEHFMNYEKGSHEEKTTDNRRNGKGSTKKVKTQQGEFEVTTPRDRNGEFEPIIVPKRKRLITDLADQITLLYAKGNSIRDIKEILLSIYGANINEEFISKATSMVSEEVTTWEQRPLKEAYAIIYMDCLYVPVRINSVSQQTAVYVALGIDLEGNKEIIGFWTGDNEAASFWYGILEEIKERGVKDILFMCTDGVTGFKEILEESFPKTTHQKCIVHLLRNFNKFINKKESKEVFADLKNIYKAPNKESALDAIATFREKYKSNHLLMNKFENNVNSFINFFDYSANIRKLIYTTNAIESVNSSLRKVTNGKGSFVNVNALEKVLYLRVVDLEKKWKRRTISNWPVILNELIEIYGDRVEKYISL